MSLADRLNSALAKNSLTPAAVSEQIPVSTPQPKPTVKESEKIPKEWQGVSGGGTLAWSVLSLGYYKTLKEGLKSAHKHSPGEFGTTVIVVENIGDKIQLPMKAGKYIVDDIQKRTDGRYEVHLVSDQR